MASYNDVKVVREFFILLRFNINLTFLCPACSALLTMIMIMSIMAPGCEVRAWLMTRSYSKSANLNYFCLITLTSCPRP